jgi:Cu2+-exporting ATPase
MNHCYHCDLPVPPGKYYPVEINGVQQQMCCPGCQAVAKAIVANGLTDFYQYRTAKSRQPDEALAELLNNLTLYDQPEVQKSFVQRDSGETRQASLMLEGIVCAACVWLNERHVNALPGVKEFRINYSTRRALVKWDDAEIHLSDILKAISAIGYIAHPFDASRQEKLQKRERGRALRGLAIAGLGAMQVMMLAVAMYASDSDSMDESLRHFMRWTSLVITLPVVFYSAAPFFKSAWRDLKYRQLGMDVPVSLAIGLAFAASAWGTVTQQGEIYFDSVTMFTFFLLGGRYLEMMARHRAGQAAEELIRLLPVTATRVVGQQEQVISASELRIDDVLRVKPGETVPADGRIIEGSSAVDESLLSGESLPVSRTVGDRIIGGSINTASPLLMRVEQLGEDTVLSSIVRLLDRAQTEKPRLAQLADRLAGWFVAVILILAGIIAWYWWQHDPAHAFQITLSVLVVTCPCALSLATPAALVAATGRLTRLGLLTTRGHALETLARVNHIVFDKTGTLTEGELALEQIIPLAQLSEEQVHALAAAVETGSEHPVAQAITAQINTSMSVTNSQSYTGRGMQATVDGHIYRLGTPEFVSELNQQPLQHQALEWSKGIIVLGDATRMLALFVLSDKLREQADSTIADLKSMKIKVSLLSGDREEIVNSIANKLAISHAKAGLLPEQKLAAIQTMQQRGEIVAMVGDGVNDAPVLAASQVSIAMGSGSQIAHASADMVLLSSRLPHIVEGIRMSRRTLSIIKQNLIWALGYNLVALPLAAAGMVAPWMAAIGMSASSLIVVLNALRLTR